MKFLPSACLAAMLGATSLIAFNASAQQPAPAAGAPVATAAPARPQVSEEDRSAFRDAHFAAMKAMLRLTPEQEKLWPPVEQALRATMTQRAARLQAMRGAQATPPDPVAQMRAMADAAIARGENMRKIADAAQPLYASLDDQQKRRVGLMMAHGRGMGGGIMGGDRMRMPRGAMQPRFGASGATGSPAPMTNPDGNADRSQGDQSGAGRPRDNQFGDRGRPGDERRGQPSPRNRDSYGRNDRSGRDNRDDAGRDSGDRSGADRRFRDERTDGYRNNNGSRRDDNRNDRRRDRGND